MAWLGKFLAAFLPGILEWLYGKTAGAVREWLAARRREKDIKDAAEAVRKQTEAAQTPEERARAADSTRNNW